MIGAFVVFVILAVAVGCLVGFGANRNRFGTVHMKLGQHNLTYLMDDNAAQPANRASRRARGRA
jgi:hypothetical protein